MPRKTPAPGGQAALSLVYKHPRNLVGEFELPDVDGLEVAVDTETSALHVDDGATVAVVSLAWRDPDTNDVVSVAFPFDQGLYGPDGEAKVLPANHQKRTAKWPDWATEPVDNLSIHDWGALMDWLALQRHDYHNAKFDLLMLRRGTRHYPGRDFEDNVVWDSQLAQSVIDPSRGTSLKPTSVRYGLTEAGSEDAEAKALDPWKGPKTDPRYDLIPWAGVMEDYAAKDALLTRLLKDFQWQLLEDAHATGEDPYLQGGWRYASREMRLMHVLYRMETRGLGLASADMLQAAKVLRSYQGKILQQLPFTPTPPKAKAYFFGPPEEGGLGLLPGALTDTGQPQLDIAAVEQLVKKGVPYSNEYARHEEVKSALSKWYDAWPNMVGADQRLRTNHRQTAVVSGRLSVERVQLQAIPQEFHFDWLPTGVGTPRSYFQPKPGFELWEIDMSQAEPRVATAMAACTPMFEAFARGEDSHGAACYLMFRGVFEDPDHPLFDPAFPLWNKDHPKWGEYRQVAKRINLAILYAAGVTACQHQIEKFTGIRYPLAQVSEWVGYYRAAFPQFTRATKVAADKAEKQGWVKLVNGKRRYFAAYEPYHKAFNQVIQGSVAEVMKDVMIEADNALITRNDGTQLLLQVHDSLWIETPKGKSAEVMDQVGEIMSRQFETAFARKWKKDGPTMKIAFPTESKRVNTR